MEAHACAFCFLRASQACCFPPSLVSKSLRQAEQPQLVAVIVSCLKSRVRSHVMNVISVPKHNQMSPIQTQPRYFLRKIVPKYHQCFEAKVKSLEPATAKGYVAHDQMALWDNQG